MEDEGEQPTGGFVGVYFTGFALCRTPEGVNSLIGRPTTFFPEDGPMSPSLRNRTTDVIDGVSARLDIQSFFY